MFHPLRLMASSSKSFTNLCLLALFVVFCSSCVPNKKLVYLSNKSFNTKELTPIASQPVVYQLQPRDILSIRIKTLDPESSEYFNIQPQNGFMNLNEASVFLSSYSIDDDGNIKLPEVGVLKIAGLTVQEAQQKIQEAIGVYLNKATILVKLVSFKVTVLGEVNNPGQYYVYNDQLTVLEGLGMAGDLTDFGNRENITLVRQADSNLGAVLINLKDPNILSSKFYYLQPNDVLYVQPLKAKSARGNLNTLSVLSVVFGAVSTAILILNYIK